MKGITQGAIATALGIALFVISIFIISPTVSHEEQEAYLQNLFDGAGFILVIFGVVLIIFSIRAKKVKN